MTDIIEIFIQIMMAYFQIIIVFFGALFTLFGLSAFLSVFQRRRKYRHWFTGTVFSIREGDGITDENGNKSKQYFPVFEGVGLDGKLKQYEYQTATTNIDHYKIGARFQMTVDVKNDNFVLLIEDDRNDFLIGAVLSVLGGMMCSLPIIFIPYTKFSLAVWAVTAIVGIFKFSKYIKPKHLRESIAQFRERKGTERLTSHQSKPILSQDIIREKSVKIGHLRSRMNKVTILIGFIILVLGGYGYNTQLEFIENSTFEKIGPCGLELGEDCHRPILNQDILSMVPIELRPVMEGIYISKYDSNKLIVNYGSWTPWPYFIFMGLGILVILGAIRSNENVKKSI